ncbi:zinc-binding dehydrogenase [Parahaliea maris]|uniref:Zinc-binding dehydrogenase n=1 Tax=Parahaliea maris TaxID=2716870 RepID=A0A5C9A8U5_9GAMM|nr:medium chain dehydrogenase/reductase family protein [Parahaliea maris]TXS96110.1 zinc-binding dehydrogenase [Parahaliea maris]
MEHQPWKRIELKAFGGPEELHTVLQAELPEPGPGEVRVKVLTAGTGFTDTIIRQGQYVDVKDKPPFVLGYDWFGVVDAIGEGVSGFVPGDPVADMSVIGGYTQYLCVAADRLVKAPAGLDPAAAVCMILSYTTAYQMLTRECTLKPGDSILVHAAGGAVGTALLELGSEMGLKVYGTASSAKHPLLTELGAEPIDYRNEDFVDVLMRKTDGRGVDAVFDTIGGKNWSRSYRCLAFGGKLVAFGALQVTTGEERVPALLWGFAKLLVLWRILPDGRKTSFYNIHTRRQKHPEEFKADVETLFSMLAAGRLSPVVAQRRPLEDAAAVHREIDVGAIAGKVVLDCWAG